jgi:hypothetical protein
LDECDNLEVSNQANDQVDGNDEQDVEVEDDGET